MKHAEETIFVLGVPFRSLTRTEAHRAIAAMLNTKGNARIFTPNPEMLWHAHRDPILKHLLLSADLLLPDGNGVLLAARLCGETIPERIAGIETGEWVLRYAAARGLSVFLLGGKEDVAEAAKERLCRQIPTLDVCGTHHGYFNQDNDSRENQAVVEQIRAAAPDILLVCFGFPRQERWIAANTPSLPSLRLSMGLGGSLDVWSGRVRRAPRWVRRCKIEWLWRALCEPRRLWRLTYIPRFLGAVMKERA